MTEVLDSNDARMATAATGLLRAFNRAGVVEAADVHVASRLAELAGDDDPRVALAVALAVRAVRHGAVCVDLSTVAEDLEPLVEEVGQRPSRDQGLWPDPGPWLDAVTASPLVEAGVVRVEYGLLYLDRYHRQEVQVRDDLAARAGQQRPAVDEDQLTEALARVFPDTGYDEQRAAARQAVGQWTTVLTGGPGTGKTTTVAGLLALVADQARTSSAATGRAPSIALTAPTGKAAARLQESVMSELRRMPVADQELLHQIMGGQVTGGLQAMTLHRLLGWRPDNSTRFRHDRANRLGHDVVVVDEASMVSLTMMARLLEAVRPDTRLIFVGDADQLTSVDAGAVLSDLVAGYAGRDDSPVATLATTHRFGEEIGRLAAALRRGDADEVLDALHAGSAEVELVTGDPAEALRADVLAAAMTTRAAALDGDAEAAVAALDRHRLLCAHRDGLRGVHHWNAQIERWLAEVERTDYWPQWYAGRPLMVTANDYALGVYNGDTGVVVRRPDGSLRAMVSGSAGLLDFATPRLSDVETMHALTIHKSQGSQADHVTVLLPDEGSRLLTRELFYTAVTRARLKVRVVGSEAAVRAAVARRALRASGLRQRLAAEPS
jgi:exodeoxyribonuclease V alpha subunit